LLFYHFWRLKQKTTLAGVFQLKDDLSQ